MQKKRLATKDSAWYAELERLADNAVSDWQNPLTAKIEQTKHIVALRDHLEKANGKKR